MIAKAGEAIGFYHSLCLHNGEGCVRWPYGHNNHGRAVVSIERKRRLVGRLLCEETNGPAPTPRHEAAHECGNGWCVNRAHLSWKTHAQNEKDKLIHGTHNRGEKHVAARLSRDDVIKIRKMKGKTPRRFLAAMFGVRPMTITDIQSGKSWAWLEDGL